MHLDLLFNLREERRDKLYFTSRVRFAVLLFNHSIISFDFISNVIIWIFIIAFQSLEIDRFGFLLVDKFFFLNFVDFIIKQNR